MKFSIVIPLYNKAPYVGATLASVAAQTCSDYEVIVVDDGSTDGGPALVAALGLAWVRLLSQPNAGVSMARNRGVAQARGEWIAFLDADDWWHPTYLDSLCRMIDQGGTGTAMVATGFVNVRHEASAAFASWPVAAQPTEQIHDLYAEWYRRTLFFTSSVAVRASVLKAFEPCFPPGETAGEDMDVWFRSAETAGLAFDPAPRVYRLLVPLNLSGQLKVGQEPPFLRRIEQRAHHATMPARLYRSARHFVAQSRISMARACLEHGHRQACASWLRRAPISWGGRRWWACLLLLLLPVPAAQVRRWSAWRTRRRSAR